MDYAGIAERFIATMFPNADIAVVGGSTARGERTATSDLDLLLLGEDLFDAFDDDRTGLASTYEFEGEVIEVFAYTRAGFDEWAGRGIAEHRPVIVHLLVEGEVLRGGDRADELRRAWGAVLDTGPAVTDHELMMRRYVITDVLDDLRDATDPLERTVLAHILFQRTAELILLGARQWVATGKHLPRRLRALEPRRAESLSRPLLAGDLGAFADAVEAELDRAGGRVQAGFTR